MSDTFEKKKEEYRQAKREFMDAPVGGVFTGGDTYDDEGFTTSSKISWVGKQAGIASSWVGENIGIPVSEMARDIPEFVAVAPYREIKEDVEAGTFLKNVSTPANIVSQAAGIGQYWAKGIYDWDDPENEKYKWTTNTNWQAVKGAVDVALIATGVGGAVKGGTAALSPTAAKASLKAATATKAGRFVTRLGTSVAGSVVGTEAFKTGGYAVATPEEKVFIDKGTEFQEAMQTGFAADEKQYGENIPVVGTTLLTLYSSEACPAFNLDS